jgi:hypothetical protein
MIILALWLLSGVLSIGGWVLLKRYYRSDGPIACGACGYPVRGLTSWTCPECGADLQAVGTTPPGRRLSGLPLYGWALLLTVPAFIFLLPIVVLLVRAVLGLVQVLT